MQRRTVLAGLLLASLTLPTVAELPPIPAERRLAQAGFIVEGEVLSVTHTDNPLPRKSEARGRFVNRNYTAQVRILKVEKGDGLEVGQTVSIRYWKAQERPRGWAGPGGQYQLPNTGQRIRAYLGSSNEHNLLNPNGWEPLD